MKRRLIKMSAAILVVVGILLAMLVVLTRDWGPEMSFGFLDDKTLTARMEKDPGRSPYRMTREVYSFEADFNDVCADVEAELAPLGFTRWMGGPGFDICEYTLSNSSTKRLDVKIINRNILSVYSTPKSSKYSSPDRHEYHWRNGWLSVEIARTRLRSWPPQYFLIRLQMMLQRNAGKPPPKKSRPE